MPALYVAQDNYLAQQVLQQVRAGLGIETTDDPECSAYLAGKRIAVVNIHKLIDGKSVFGGPASTRSRLLRIGTVVVDDAHAALAKTDARAPCALRVRRLVCRRRARPLGRRRPADRPTRRQQCQEGEHDQHQRCDEYPDVGADRGAAKPHGPPALTSSPGSALGAAPAACPPAHNRQDSCTGGHRQEDDQP